MITMASEKSFGVNEAIKLRESLIRAAPIGIWKNIPLL